MLKHGILIFLLVFQMPSYAFAVTQGAPQPAVETYDQLLHAIRAARVESKQRIQQEKVRLAWETGKLIDTHVLQHKARAEYGNQVLNNLARDLQMSRTELYYMLQFARSYATVPPAGQLSWSYYRELLSINDPEARRALAEKAIAEDWDRDRLRAEVQKINAIKEDFAFEKLEARAGIPYTYRVIQSSAGTREGGLMLDLGFSNYYETESLTKFKEGDVVRLGAGKALRRVNAAETNPADLQTYEAVVTRVVDGDTFYAVVDLGFGFTTVQKLRLRGLDAPEMDTEAGQTASDFLQATLTDRVTIRTSRSDKYDRYLTDVFVDGVYVNQALLDAGHALRLRSGQALRVEE